MTFPAPHLSGPTRVRNRRMLVGLGVAGLVVLAPIGVLAWAFSDQTTINGALSAGPDGAGGVRVTMTLCEGTVDTVQLYDERNHPADRREPDKPVGIWERTAPATSDVSLVLGGSPGPGWKVVLDPGPLDPGALYDVLAGSWPEHELSQVTFDPGQVADLPSGGALFHNAEPVPATGVRASACS